MWNRISDQLLVIRLTFIVTQIGLVEEVNVILLGLRKSPGNGIIQPDSFDLWADVAVVANSHFVCLHVKNKLSVDHVCEHATDRLRHEFDRLRAKASTFVTKDAATLLHSVSAVN